MSKFVTSTFEVVGWEELPADANENPNLIRIEVIKEFSGKLEGKSTAERMMYVTDRNDPSTGTGYVAIEQFTGSVDGMNGSFVLQHGGLVSSEGIQKSVGHIVPKSGTGALEGIRGVLEISISAAGVHTLTLDYLFE